MTARKLAAAGVALVALVLGCTACHEQASTPSSTGSAQDELNRIQTTLDAIDSEVAGDGSP